MSMMSMSDREAAAAIAASLNATKSMGGAPNVTC